MKNIVKKIQKTIKVKKIKTLTALELLIQIIWNGYEFQVEKTKRGKSINITLLEYDGIKPLYEKKIKLGDFNIRTLKRQLNCLISNYEVDLKLHNARLQGRRNLAEKKANTNSLDNICKSVKEQVDLQRIIDKKISDLMELHSSKVAGKISQSEKAMIEEIIAKNPDKDYNLCRCDSYTKTDLIIDNKNYQLKNITSKKGRDGKIRPTQATIFSYRYKNVLGSDQIDKEMKELLLRVGGYLTVAVANNYPTKDRMLSSVLTLEEGKKVLNYFLKEGNLIQKMKGRKAHRVMVWDSNIEGKNALRIPTIEWLYYHTKLEARSASSKQRKEVHLQGGWTFPEFHKCKGGELCTELKLVSTGWIQFQQNNGFLPSPYGVKK